MKGNRQPMLIPNIWILSKRRSVKKPRLGFDAVHWRRTVRTRVVLGRGRTREVVEEEPEEG